MEVRKPKQHFLKIFYLIGLPVSLIILLSSIFLLVQLRQAEFKHQQRIVKADATIVRNEVQKSLSNYTNLLMRMGLRWDILNRVPQKAWEADATTLYKQIHIFDSLQFVSSSLKLHWYVPQNEKLSNLNLQTDPRVLQILQSAAETGKITYSNNIFIKSEPAFLIAVPVYNENKLDGYIVAVINTKKLFEQIFQNNKNFNIAIYQNNEPVYVQQVNSANNNIFLTQNETLNFNNINWDIYVWPTSAFLADISSSLSKLSLLSGVLTAFLVLFIFYFFDRARLNAIKTEEAKQEIEKSAQRFHRILDSMNEAFITINEKSEIIDWNPHAEKIFGWKFNEAKGEKMYDLIIPNQYREAHKKGMAKFLAHGEQHVFYKILQMLALRKDGLEFPVELTIFPIKNEENYEFHSFIRDITQRKAAEIDQARLVAIIDASDDAILSTNPEGMITTWNSGAEKLYGYKATEVIGMPVTIIYPKDLIVDFPAIISKVNAGEHIHNYDTTRKHRDGHIIPVSVSIAPMLDVEGKIVGMSSITTDITERKKIERMKNEFISVVSHELRTPLTSIKGSIGLLASDKICDLSEKARQLLDIANSNCERLIRLINDMLDIEKIEAGRMDFKFNKVDLTNLIQEAIAANQPLAQKSNVILEFQSPGKYEIRADYDRITQVITNLLSNAIRFSPPHQKVKIRLSSLLNRVRVSITNFGPGIPKEFQSKIFGKFIQADSSDSRQKSGTGLGLNISKAIVEKHGGTISFVSTQDNGTTFYFELPQEPHLPITDASTNKEPVHVLICDHHQEVAKYLKDILEDKEIIVDIVHSAKEAQVLLQQRSYTALTIDLSLPDEDGISFIKKLRKDPKTKNLPVVVTSVMPEQGLDTLNGLTVIDWVDKPLDASYAEKINDYIDSIFWHKKPNILNIEDDLDTTSLLRLMLQDRANIMNAIDLESAKKLLQERAFDLIILDLRLPDGVGTELLPCINIETQQPIPVIVFSAYELGKEHAHLVKQALLKSVATNRQIFKAIESAIKQGK